VGDAVATAVEQGLVARKDLFLATKLSDPRDAGYANTRALVARQLRDLRTSYLDLYMLHSPLPDAQLQADTWRALEDLLAEGTLRAIGVSNFQSAELRALESTARVRPMVVQNKADPYHIGKQLDNAGDPIVAYCRERGVLLVAYSTLSAYPFAMQPTEDPIVRAVAHRHGFTPAQVLLKWALQKGFAVIPRSTSADRLAENLSVMGSPGLPVTDVRLLDTLHLLISSPVCRPGPM
jgi:diketogulonate reductase-like aldo/keto reductase